MKNVKFAGFMLLIAVAAAFGDEPMPVTHWQFQAVTSDGSSAFYGPFQVVLEGILLNNPEEYLDPTPDPTIAPWFMGGQWQIWFQGEGDDHAGTACWIGQNYSNGPGDTGNNYTNQQWLSEICRLNRDPNTGYVFHAGDRIRVTGTYLFYAGKNNINENHEIDPLFDFKIELVKPAVGLPQPEELSISNLKDANDNFIFDPIRMTGCEYYQSRLVRIQDVNIIDPQNWGQGQTITIKNSDGRTFPVLLGIGAGISKYSCPTGQIDAIGILDQEGTGYPPNIKGGYRMVVLNYDGNGLVLNDTGHARGNLPGDINKDYIVDCNDITDLVENWLQSRAGLYNCDE